MHFPQRKCLFHFSFLLCFLFFFVWDRFYNADRWSQQRSTWLFLHRVLPSRKKISNRNISKLKIFPNLQTNKTTSKITKQLPRVEVEKCFLTYLNSSVAMNPNLSRTEHWDKVNYTTVILLSGPGLSNHNKKWNSLWKKM